MERVHWLRSVVAAAALCCSATASAATIISSASGNWNQPTTWSGGVPGAGDDVVIAGSHTVAVTDAHTVRTVSFDTGGGNKALVLGAGGTLTISGGSSALTIAQAAGTTSTVRFEGGTIDVTAGNVVVNGSATGAGVIHFFLDGTLDIAGSLTFAGTAANARITGAVGKIEIGGNLGSGGSLLGGTAFVFDGAGPQTIGGPYTLSEVEINNPGNIVQLSAPTEIHRILTLTAGTFATGSHALALAGDITTTGTFDAGTSTIHLNGIWSNNGTLNTANATLEFVGSFPSFSSNTPAQFSVITVNAPDGVSIGGENRVRNAINLNGGNVRVGGTSFTIEAGCAVNRTSGQFIGRLTMEFSASQTRTFFVGTETSSLPVDVTAGGAGDLVVMATEGRHRSRSADNVMDRYWTFDSGSVPSLTSVTFHYNQSDFTNGSEAKFALAHYSFNTWTQLGDLVNETTNTATATSVSSYVGDWAIGQRGSMQAAGRLSVTYGAQPTTGSPFLLIVEANNDIEIPAIPIPLTTSTSFVLNLVSGTGTLGGTITGMIPAGSSSTVVNGITYDKAETITIEAVVTAGEPLDSGSTTLVVRDSTYIVTTTADTGPGSLREGIDAANSGACANPCTIKFAAGGTGTIAPGFPLPTISAENLTIDGYSAPGASPNTAAFGSPFNANITVTLDGDSGGASLATLFDIASNAVTIRGLAFRNFLGEAIRINGTSNTIAGCLIGTDGTVARVTRTGIVIAAGGSANRIGGPTPADRNVIAGIRRWAIVIDGSFGNAVEGNYIGVNAAATASLSIGSGIGGVLVNGFQNIVTGNVISGHSDGAGIVVEGLVNDVQNNRIGTDGTGTAAVPNATGMSLRKQGTASGNIISGNSGEGVIIDADGWVRLLNNRIGVGATLGALGNGSHGVSVIGSGWQSRISSNVIAHNGGDGVSVTTTGIGTLIRLNELHDNTGLPIDLGDDGPTPNDPGDADANKQNFPTISTAVVNGSNIAVTVSLDSSQAASQPRFFVIDLYKLGTTLEYLGSSTYLPAPLLTNHTFSVPAGSTAAGDAIVALGTSYFDDTDDVFSPAEGTSELSPPVAVRGAKHWIAASGTWETAANWSPAGVPTLTDAVFIDNGGTYTVTINSPVSVHSLTVGGATGIQTLQVSAGQSLSMAAASTVMPGDALVLDGTSLNGTGSLDVNGTVDWRAGTISGAGILAIRNGGLFEISSSATKTLDQRTLTVVSGATARWTGGTIQLQNAGSIANTSGGFLVQTNSSIVNAGAAGAFVNGGVVHKSGAAGTTTLDGIVFQHTGGVLDIDSGVMELAGGGSANGQIDLAVGSELRISTATYTFGGGTTVTNPGGGFVRIASGQLDVNASMTIPRLQLEDGGTLAGGGLLQYGTFTWNGGTMRGTGITHGPASSTITFATAATKSLQRTLRILAGGNAVVPDTGAIDLDAGGAIQNAGTWHSQAAHAFLNAGSAGVFTNTGTFRKSGAGTTASFLGIVFDNTGGAVDVQSGELHLANGTSTGNFTLGAGAAVQINHGSIYTLAGTASSTGAGIWLLAHGTLALQNAHSLSNLTLSGGSIDGPGTLTLTGNGIWSSGVMLGAGTTVIASGATLDISTGSTKILSRRNLDTLAGGTTNWTDGLITVSLAARINNAGLFRALASNSIENAGSGTFTNTGELRATAFPFIGMPLVNTTGTLDVQNGILYAAGGYTQGATGTLKIHLGGTQAGTEYGQLVTNAPPSLAGTLQIVLEGAYQPAGSDRFRVLSFSGAPTGDFIRPFTYPALTGGRTFSDAYEPLTGLVLTVIGAPDLTIAKTASTATTFAGEPIRYTLTVNNGGTDPALGVRVTDILPTGHTNITASGGAGWNCGVAGEAVTCDATAALPSGNAADIVIDARVPMTEQTFTNTANVNSTNDPNGANNSGSVTVTVGSNAADVYLHGSGPVGPVPTATPLALMFTVANNGPQTATFVRFTVAIPPALTYNSAFLDGVACSFASQVVTCTRPSLSPPAPVTATINVTTAASGVHDLVASVAADQPDLHPVNNTLTYPITVTDNVVKAGNTNDAGPGSLRQAILDAISGVCAVPCAIVFDIAAPPPPPYRIHLASDLPNVPGGVVIDATTLPDYAGVPLLEIDGSAVAASAHLLHLAGNGSTVRGLSIINGAADGIRISGDGNRVERCYIGLTSTGAPAANRDGIRVLGNGNVIGGNNLVFHSLIAQAIVGDEGNVIANNTNSGIIVISGSGNAITGNSIHDHSLPGIDLGGDGPDFIDAGDADDGANGKQNSPTLTSAVLDGHGNVVIHYEIDSSATSANSILVEFFEADSVAGGEGMSLLKGVCVASNHFATTASLADAGITAGDAIVATATSFSDDTCTVIAGGTSEFSNALVIAGACVPASASVAGSTAICAGSSTIITATLTGTPPFNVTWSDAVVQLITTGNVASRVVSPVNATTYTVTSVTDSSCEAAGIVSGSAVITVAASPIATISAPAAVPAGSAGNTASVPAQGGALYAWKITNGVITSSTNTNAVTYTAGPGGNVVLEVTVTVGACTSTGSMPISISVFAAADVPALSTWMLIVFALALLALAVRRIG